MTHQKESGLNPNLLLVVIAVLVIAVVVMGFFLGRLSSNGNIIDNPNGGTQNFEELTVKVIKDARDLNSTVPYEALVENLKSIPSIAGAEVTIVDFADKGVKEYLAENGIKFLPAFIFSTNKFDTSADPKVDPTTGQVITPITTYLNVLPSGEYNLIVGSDYDPFVERSDRGFKLLTQEQYDKLLEQGSYVEGNENAKITWIEYSDLQCPYCARLYSEGTPGAVKNKYGSDINIRFNHFPLDFHPIARPAGEFAECLALQKGSEAFYSFIEQAFEKNNSLNVNSYGSVEKQILLDIATGLGADETTLTACVNANTFDSKITNQMSLGTELFNVTGTPGNVLINTETLEYDILSGAYPVSSFENIIDRLLAE